MTSPFILICEGSLLFMHCSNCGKCCKNTEMELSCNDIKRLERAGYRREEFSVADKGVIRLRNVSERCYFYDLAKKRCRVYGKRPLGCYLYPIVYMMDEGVTVDVLCPKRQTISDQELRTKGITLAKLIRKIDNERKCK